MEKLPYVSPELVAYLQLIHPDKCPNPNWTEREVWMAVGAASVVRHLKQLHEDQIENSLTGRK
jgi:hypothetical protein